MINTDNGIVKAVCASNGLSPNIKEIKLRSGFMMNKFNTKKINIPINNLTISNFFLIKPKTTIKIGNTTVVILAKYKLNIVK